jgi:tetratricopeptide (TPR) repeat protein
MSKMTQAALLVCLCGAVSVRAATENASAGGMDRERGFIRALSLFDAAKTPDEFRQSAAAFEALLADGTQNGAIYYNLGNAYVRAGDMGRAIAAYRKARVFRPRDPFLEANLKHALSLAPGRLSDPPKPWWNGMFFWSDWLSCGEKFHALLGCFLMAFLLACARLRWPLRGAAWGVAGLIVVATLLSVDAAITYDQINNSRRAVVVQETVARKGNSASYEPAFDQPLKDGAEFTIIECRGDWVFGRFDGVGDGWLRQEVITR